MEVDDDVVVHNEFIKHRHDVAVCVCVRVCQYIPTSVMCR